jgi:hypothetical protein
MQEQRTTLNSSIPPSRKRPLPSSNICLQTNFAGPDVQPTQGNEEFPGPSRARTFPHGLLARANKRNSMPNSTINPALNVSETHSQQPMTPQAPTAYGTPSSSGSGSTSAPFGQQHTDPNIPDLRAVMFPSENPFAYPNQPMSTLEGMQYMSPEDQQQEPLSGGTSEQNFGMPNNAHMPPELSFNDLNNSVFGSNLAQQYHSNRHFSAPMGATNFPMTMDEGMGISVPQDEYWPHLKKQAVPQGMTPAGLNLDELFGGEGWNNVWNEQNFSGT